MEIPSSPPLYKLPLGGDWVDPRAVTRVVFLEQSPPCPKPQDIRVMPRVVVWVGSDPLYIICIDNSEAMRVRDEIGAALNAMRRSPAASPDLYKELENARGIIAAEAPQYGLAIERIDVALAKARGEPS